MKEFCTKCGQELMIWEVRRYHPKNQRYLCSGCLKEMRRSRSLARSEHSKSIREIESRRGAALGPDELKKAKGSLYHNSAIVRKYRITPAQYRLMLQEQGGKCAICQKPPGRKRLSVDHCHTSGRIRGLLCSHCNSILGFSLDMVDILESAIRYLQK